MDLDNHTLIHHFLESAARRQPQKTAMVCGQRRHSYQELELQSNRLAAWLSEGGLQPGERVLLVSENGPAYVAGYFGILKAGGVVVPANTESRAHELRRIAGQIEAVAAIGSRRFEKLLYDADLAGCGTRRVGIFGPVLDWKGQALSCHDLDPVASQGNAQPPGTSIRPESLASIIFTSGSTGTPKGVMLSHRNIVANVHAICRYQELSSDDIHMVVLPFFYVMGQSLLNTHFAVGGTVIVNNQFAYPATVVKQMVEEKVTGFSGVPSTYAYLIHRSPIKKVAGSLQALRFCAQAGGHMAMHLKRELRAILPAHTRIFIMYGATEAAARITYLDPAHYDAKIGSIGKAIPGMTVRIVDPQRQPLPAGAEGELVAQGPSIMMGYWRDPDATAAVLDGDGYRTGDLGYQDNEGFIFITGRKDGLIKVSGHRVNPQEIEETLVASNLLLEVAVVSRPDEMAGNLLVAIAAPKEEACRPEDLLRFCTERLPSFKIPSEIRLIKSLPKNSSGKIDKKQCGQIV
jgi:acyl-CoA synthetase (AMP-forming)/AMP-acid ligase II